MIFDTGIDVSRYQNQPITDAAGKIVGYKPLDYAKAKAQGIAFAAVRCTVGNYYIDPTFVMNYLGFVGQGLETYAYMVVAPKGNIGGLSIGAAQHIEKLEEAFALLPERPKTEVILDCEMDRGATVQYITALIEKIASLLQPASIIYTRKSWWDPYVLRSSRWKQYKLHVAHYGVSVPALPLDWDDWFIHQYSADGNGLGKQYGCYSASVDLNRRKVEVQPPPPPDVPERVKANIQVAVDSVQYVGEVYLTKI